MAPKKLAAKPVSFRLSEDARKHLAQLAQSQGISMTAVLELLIRKEATEKNKP
jgi:predicted HicB family RNase H-like nuclease